VKCAQNTTSASTQRSIEWNKTKEHYGEETHLKHDENEAKEDGVAEAVAPQREPQFMAKRRRPNQRARFENLPCIARC
jgi:hypothetical protein